LLDEIENKYYSTVCNITTIMRIGDANYSKRNAARIRIFLIGSLIVVVMLYTLIEKYSFSLSDFIQQL